MIDIEPWRYECKRNKDGTHLWAVHTEGGATCVHCKLYLNLEEAQRCFSDPDRNKRKK